MKNWSKVLIAAVAITAAQCHPEGDPAAQDEATTSTINPVDDESVEGAQADARAVTILAASSRSVGAVDPGPRPGPAAAGGALQTLSANERAVFDAAKERFLEVDSVSGTIEAGSGLGPTFNANSCASCHIQPEVGGSSPHPTLGQIRKPNPLIALATLDRVAGGAQTVPQFILADGPVREARFIRNQDGSLDGGVHGIFTIAGRRDAPGCVLAQPDFGAQLALENVIFRIPTPVFGLGLVENVTDDALVAGLALNANMKRALGIRGRLNRSGNDGTTTRFGWKAQNKSLLIFVGEAYNVEQGVSNELFPQERATATGCQFNPTPEDSTNFTNPSGGGTTGSASQMSSDTVNFAIFIRLLAPPTPVAGTSSERHGQTLFGTNTSPGIGCVLCHNDTLRTNRSIFTGAGGIDIHPYSDFAIHRMGPRLADFVKQGAAGFDEFRSAPLWGAGQRIFFLHDGRASPANGGLVRAILEHKSSNPFCRRGQLTRHGVACASEANAVVDRFLALRASDQQDVVNFLRSL